MVRGITQLRQSIKLTPYRQRTQGKCAMMVLKQKESVKHCTILLLLYIMLRNRRERLSRICCIIGLCHIIQYLKIKNVSYQVHRWKGHQKLSFNNIDNHNCWHYLRFKKRHLWRLSQALLLPENLILDNGARTNNEEMLIVLLARLSHSSSGSWIKLERQYGMEYSMMSRIFKVSTSHIFSITTLT